MFPTYRNQSIDLQCKSIDWFLYERNIGMKKVNDKPICILDVYVITIDCTNI